MKKHRQKLLILIVLAIVAIAVKLNSGVARQYHVASSKESGEIIRAYLVAEHTDPLLVSSYSRTESVTGLNGEYADETAKSLDIPSELMDFVSQTSSEGPLPSSVLASYPSITPAEAKALPNTRYYEEMFGRFSGNVCVQVSQPVVNADGLALFAYSSYSGELNGEAGWVVCRRTDGKWNFEKTKIILIS